MARKVDFCVVGDNFITLLGRGTAWLNAIQLFPGFFMAWLRYPHYPSIAAVHDRADLP